MKCCAGGPLGFLFLSVFSPSGFTAGCPERSASVPLAAFYRVTYSSDTEASDSTRNALVV